VLANHFPQGGLEEKFPRRKFKILERNLENGLPFPKPKQIFQKEDKIEWTRLYYSSSSSVVLLVIAVFFLGKLVSSKPEPAILSFFWIF